MPRSSRHKLHKHSKHSSKDYSDSEEDVVKMKEKSSKNHDSTSAEKRKISSQVLDSKDLSGHGNGEVSEDYVSTKRRKEKSGVNVGSDRWNAGGDERGDSDSNMDGEMHKGESLRTESKSKSKRHGTGSAGEKKEDNLMMEREESKSKGESRRKSESDSSSVRKEGKELKDKERRSEKEKEKEKNGGQESKNGGQESKSGDAAVKVVDTDVRKKQGSQWGDFSEERQGKRAREHSERTVQEELQNPELDKEAEKRIHRRREGSSERDKQYSDLVEDDGRSSRGDRDKDVKFRDDKLKDGSHADKYQEDSRKDDKRRDDKYRNDADKDNQYQDGKYREDGEKNAKRRLNKHQEDGDRDNRRKYEKDRDNGERDNRRKDNKYRQGIEYDDQRVDKYHEDSSKNSRRKEGRYLEDAEKDIKYVDERYHDDGDDRHRDNTYKDDGNRDHRREEEKYRDDSERQSRHKNSKQGDEFDREKRMKDAQYRDEFTSRDRSDERSDHKRSRDDGYAAEHHSRKSSVYYDSPARDDRTAKHRDVEVRRRIDEKDDHGDSRSRGTRDQRSDAEKKSSTGARIEQVTDRVQNRRQSSPTTSSHTPRDHYWVQKQDESKYRDYNYEARVRHTISASGDYSGAVGGFEKTSSARSLEKIGTKDDDHLAGLSAERRLKPDIRSSPLRFVDNSPSSSNDRRLFSKPDLRQSIDVEESTERSGGSRDTKEFSGKEGRGSRNPVDEFLPAEADTLSVSSSFTRSNHFSSSSKSFAPPPLFRGVDSPLLSGSNEDDGRGKSSIRHRRIIDPNMGRIQGNAWRGVPRWPSPVGNGFLPFPHGPPPVNFHSVMQPFPAPPMFGVRPSMDLRHPAAPYLMPGADRFSGPGRPMGWHNQVDDSCPPLHAWDASNSVFGDESHIYGRSDWDHPRDLPGSGGWGSSDLLGGPNENATSEMPFSEKGNNSVRSADEAMADESNLPFKNEPATADQQVKSIDISQSTKNSEKNDVDTPPVTSQEISDVKMMSRTDDVPLFHVYLLKLDISSDITELECFSKCTGLIDVDQSIYSDVDGAKFLCMEGAIEAKMAYDKLLNDTMLRSNDNSVLQKSMSLYQMQKQNLLVGDGNELNVTSKVTLQLDQEDQNVEDDRTEKLCPIDNMQAGEYPIPMEEDPQESLAIDETVSNALKISTEPASSDLVFDQGDLQENNVEEKASSPLPSEVKAVSMEVAAINNEELKLGTKCGNADVSSEAIMMPELVNLSRIHHSPESTH